MHQLTFFRPGQSTSTNMLYLYVTCTPQHFFDQLPETYNLCIINSYNFAHFFIFCLCTIGVTIYFFWFRVDSDSLLHKDLIQLKKKCGKGKITLNMTFTVRILDMTFMCGYLYSSTVHLCPSLGLGLVLPRTVYTEKGGNFLPAFW